MKAIALVMTQIENQEIQNKTKACERKKEWLYNRIICKVRKPHNQNPKFGRTQCEILKKPTKKYINI
jgi:hypothetical protein